MPNSLIEMNAEHICFRNAKRTLAAQPLSALDRAYTVFCFNPEVAPMENESYNVLAFGDALWIVPDEGASRYITGAWAEHLANRGGFYFAESGELPKDWRRRYLLVAKHPYYPKPVVVPKQTLPFTRTSERIDPRYLSQYNQRYATEHLKA